MVIEYERTSATMRGEELNLPNLSIEDIATIVGTTKNDGTTLTDVPKINAAFQKAMPPISFVVDSRCSREQQTLPENEEIIKTSFRIPRKLKKEVERYSVESDKTETVILKEALEEYLQRHWKK
jgi:hypothetical protein